MAEIIQWNCRGLKANRQEVELLIQKYNPSVLLLQETKVPINSTISSFKGFNTFLKIGTIDNEGRAHGGSMILVKNSLAKSEIPLTTNLQAVACRVSLSHDISLCSIYVPPHQSLAISELENVIQQLKSPFILCGDFNAHSPLWGGSNIDSKGKIIEKLLEQSNICLWNDDSATYLHPALGSFSSIDLSMCSPGIFLNYQWRVEEDQWGSDHFPILLFPLRRSDSVPLEKWQFLKADWESFSAECKDKLNTSEDDQQFDISSFTSTLLDISNKYIPKKTKKIG